MAERKRTPKQGGRSAGRKPPNRTGKPLNVWLQSELRDAIDVLVERSRRSLTTEVTIALEEYLTRAGLWPPPAADAAGKGE